MSIIQLQWEVGSLTTLLADGYDYQKVEYESAPATWTELTTSTTRLPLVDNAPRYVWHTPLGSDTDTFRIVPYRSTDDSEETPITTFLQQQVAGYCTVQDMRDEGYNDPPYNDARVQFAISLASRRIERFCGQRFAPHFGKYKLDVKRIYEEHTLDEPIIAVYSVSDGGGDISMTDLEVYNRHLTEGMLVPDDRRNPMIAFTNDTYRPRIYRDENAGRFHRGRQTLMITGVFGFTELGDGDMPGETVDGSQIPISFGQTPAAIRWACIKLATNYLAQVGTSSGSSASLEARIVREWTRDQGIQYSPISEEAISSAYGMTGDEEVDAILIAHLGPLNVGAI